MVTLGPAHSGVPEGVAFLTPSQTPQTLPMPPLCSPSPFLHPGQGCWGGGVSAIPQCIYSVVIADIFFLSPVKPREESLSECKFKALSYLSSDQ